MIAGGDVVAVGGDPNGEGPGGSGKFWNFRGADHVAGEGGARAAAGHGARRRGHWRCSVGEG